MSNKIEKLDIKKIEDMPHDHDVYKPGIQSEADKNDELKGKQGTMKKPKKRKEKKVGKIRAFFAKIIVWFNGKKTIIGTSGTLIGIGLTKIPEPVCQVTGYALMALFGALAGTGIVHKFVKTGKVAGASGELKIGKIDLIELLKETWRLLKLWVEFFKAMKGEKK